MAAKKPEFSKSLLDLVKLSDFSGQEMIATSRAILRNDYSDDEFNLDFFSIFILIDDESGHIILTRFGEYNFASERLQVGVSDIHNSIRIAKSMLKEKKSGGNEKILKDDIAYIEYNYGLQFRESLNEFIRFFAIKL